MTLHGPLQYTQYMYAGEWQIPVAVQSKSKVQRCLIAWITGLNPSEGMDVHLVCLLWVIPCQVNEWKTRPSPILFILGRLGSTTRGMKNYKFSDFYMLYFFTYRPVKYEEMRKFSQTCSCEINHKSGCNWHRRVW
jgi:hypothetical protein